MSKARSAGPNAGAYATNASDAGAPSQTLGGMVCDWTIGVLCVWTVACHFAVVTGGSLYAAMIAFGVFGTAALAGYAFFFRRAAKPVGSEPDGGEAPSAPPQILLHPEWNWKRIYWIFCGIAIVLVGLSVYDYVLGLNAIRYWWATVFVLGAAYVVTENQFTRGGTPPKRIGEHDELYLWSLGGALAIFLLFVHYSVPDDTFYVSLAARAADNPSVPVMTQDPMWGIEGMPMLNPAHIVSSHELFAGAVSLLTGIEPMYVFHWGIASFAALLAPLALARLFRVLIPGWWLWGVVATLAVLIAVGDTQRWYGTYLVGRLWLGKSILLMVVVPLIAYYAMQFARRGTVGGWLMLAMAQVVALGLSSTGIFVAPVTATLSSVVMLPWTKRGAVRLLLVTASSAYVLIAALLLRSHMAYLNEVLAAAAEGRHEMGRYPKHEMFGDWLGVTFEVVLGRGRLAAMALAAIALAWMAYPRNVVARRFLILLPLGLFLTLLNPYLERFVVANVTALAHWRLMWILPVPALIALALVGPLQWRTGGRLASVILLTCFVLLIPSRTSLSREIFASVHAPTAKASPVLLEPAQALHTRVPAGSSVLAWERVANVIPQFRDSAFPVVPRIAYLENVAKFRGVFSEDEHVRRQRIHTLMHLDSADHADDPRVQRLVETEFGAALRAYEIAGVVLFKAHPFLPQLENALMDAGFTLEWENDTFRVWIREDAG